MKAEIVPVSLYFTGRLSNFVADRNVSTSETYGNPVSEKTGSITLCNKHLPRIDVSHQVKYDVCSLCMCFLHLQVRMAKVKQVGLLAAGCQPWNKDVCAASGDRFAYCATLAIYIYQVNCVCVCVYMTGHQVRAC